MDDLIRDFIKLTLDIRKYEAMPRKANEAYKKRHLVFKQLKKNGKLNLLEPLLSHEDIDVSSRAAVYFLIVEEGKAMEKLLEIKKVGGIKGYEIDTLINQWKRGELIVDHD